MTITPVPATRRSARLAAPSVSTFVSHSDGSDSSDSGECSDISDRCGSDSDSPVESFCSSSLLPDSSLLDPTLMERDAVNAIRKLKDSLLQADDEGVRKRRRGLKGLDGVELIRGTSGSQSVEGGEEWKWGRAMNNDWLSAVLAFGMMSVSRTDADAAQTQHNPTVPTPTRLTLCCHDVSRVLQIVPFVVLLMLHSCKFHQCSIQASLVQAVTEGRKRFESLTDHRCIG
jgi:hypothetical protein